MDTKERLLDTAARLFHEQGFHATGIQTLLREAGLHPGSLYHVFRNKEELLIGVLERYQELLWPVVLGPVEAAEPDPIERIFRLLDWYRAGMVQNGCRLGCPIGNLALETSDSYPAVRPGIEANLEGWRRGIRGWLRRAADRLPADCDLDDLSTFVLTVMEGGLLQARAADDLAPFDASVRVLRDHFDRLTADAIPNQP